MVTIGLAVLIRSLIVLIWDADPHPFSGGLPETVIPVGGVGL